MKDKLDIEELFQDKFSSFEGNVPPEAWANIQQGMGAAGGSAAGATGISSVLKVALISGGIIAASIIGVYIASDSTKDTNDTLIVNEDNVPLVLDEPIVNEIINDDIIYVIDQNDPVIEENRADLEKEILQSNEPTNEEVNYDFSEEGEHSHEEIIQDVTVDAGQSDNSLESDFNRNIEQIINDNDEEDIVEAFEIEEVEEDYPNGQISFVSEDEFAPKSFEFQSNAVNYESVKWNFGDGKFGTGKSIKHVYEMPGKYNVVLTVLNGSLKYEEKLELIIESKSSIDNIPNAFTPNGDRINDQFYIKSTEIDEFFISVLDQKGRKVYESNDKDFLWNGTDLSGNVLEEGRYTYMIVANGTDDSNFKLRGQIYIKR